MLTRKYDGLRISGFSLLSDRVQNDLVQLEVQRGASHTGERHRVTDVFVRVHAQQNRAHVRLQHEQLNFKFIFF